MQVTGKITNIAPTVEGGYESQNGWINTFDMTIQGQNKTATGEIGSKSDTYPIPVGSMITVDMTTNQYGVKFKKVQQGQGGGQRNQGSGRGQSQGRDFNKENSGKCRFGFYQALLQAGANPFEMAEDANLLKVIETLVSFSMEGPVLAPQGGDPNPEYSDNPEPPPDDDIPF